MVYGYVDELAPLLARQWHKRLKAYARLDYVVEGSESGDVENHIVTAGSRRRSCCGVTSSV